ncbi:dormancy-associated protein homolog 3-like isoform X2 [Amaranthus tricolor]|uniref:dormancy-associated protein homolog 3-like isoform X2 n=1 Tax=Amaranthus tricolor TaxID=29722 RepID=UPI00258ADC06|nr:dormancy-associated protein homolog 3-like isoform X2 [Amaranthus tricolor]
MSLLEKLWDDTIAGPHPDSGLGRLRKFNTFNNRTTSSKEMEGGNIGRSSYGGDGTISGVDNQEEAMKVTRKIMIVKPPGYNQGAGSAPTSPAGSTPPQSPFSGSRSGAFRFRRRSTSDANEKTTNQDRLGDSPPT